MRRLLTVGVSLLLLPVLPPLAGAAQAQDGFLFGRPQAQLTVRAGPLLPRAQSDIFDFMTSELTLERGDFTAPALMAELGFIGHPRFDFVVGIGWSESEARSEFADWVGGDGLPIAQTTRLRTVPLTFTARVQPLPRGRSVSRLTWLPTRTTPYIGAGAGLTFYRLQHDGEFIDTFACEQDPAQGCDIFYREYRAADRALTVHGVAGVDHWFTPRLGLNLEARYTNGRAPGADSFRTYDALDLSALQATVGLSLRW